MIKQMERRFTIVAISVISLVLLILFILVNGISISGNIQRADDSLTRLAEAPLFDDKHIIKPENDIFEKDKKGIVDNETETTVDDFKDQRDSGKEENRSFEVVIDVDKNLISTNANDKNMIDDAVSYDMALLALKDDTDYGFVDDFRYLKIEEKDVYKFIFLDYSFERQFEINFIMVSIGVYIVAVILVTVLVFIFLKPVMRPIKESYAKQKQFITDASHEIKTPLTIISTDMELLEMENGPSEWIKSVNNQVERLSALTNELVTLSRMNEEDSGLPMNEINFSDIVNDVIMGFEPGIKAKGRSLEVDVEEDIMIKGHHDSIERVMSILMNNALKYNNEKGRIKVDLSQKGKKVKLIVYNSVETIEIGNHDEYFQRFFRSDASRNSETGGFGIGLAVVRSTIEEHKGRIEAKSQDGKSLEIISTFKTAV